MVLVPPGSRVALPTSDFELVVHSDADVGPIEIVAPSAPSSDLIDRVEDPSGVSVTLLVSPPGIGAVEIESCAAPFELVSTDPDRDLRYNSGYTSNCYCLSCMAYCTVNGKTDKAGTCC